MLETKPRGYERETAQLGGLGTYAYAAIGDLRCHPGDAIVGAKLSGAPVAQAMQIRCAPIACAAGLCSWSVGAAYDGPVLGRGSPAARLLQCPPGSVVAGYRGTAVQDAVGADVAFDCEPIAAPGIAVAEGDRIYPVGAPIAEPPPTGGAAPGADPAPLGVYRDTMGLQGESYDNVVHRARYYAVVAGLLAEAPATSDIHVFGATDTPPPDPAALGSEGARQTLTRIDGALFASNMRIIRALLRRGAPLDPATTEDPPPEPPASSGRTTRCTGFAATAISLALTRSGVIQALSLYCGRAAKPKDQALAGGCVATAGLSFDLKMVELEQQRVETILAAAGGAAADLDGDWNERGDRFRALAGMIGQAGESAIGWAKRFLEVEALSFASEGHRTIVGKALVFQLHHCSYEDFAASLTQDVRNATDAKP